MRFGAFAVFVLLGVVGCTGSGGAAPTTIPIGPSRASSVTIVSSPTPSGGPSVPADVPTTGPNLRYPGERPPAMPVAATKHTAAGAKAFAIFFIKTIDWGFATMSGAYIRHFAARSCLSCASFANGLDSDRKAMHRYTGGRFTVTHAAGPKVMEAVVTVNGTAFREFDQSGRLVGSEAAHRDLQFRVDLQWGVQVWSVRELRVIR